VQRPVERATWPQLETLAKVLVLLSPQVLFRLSPLIV
jgi:hypothetical protein